MKARWIVLGAVLGFAISLTLGSAFAASRWAADRPGPDASTQDLWAAMDQMHGSPWMQQFRGRMGDDLAAECDRLHDRIMDQTRDRDLDGTGPRDRDRVRDHVADSYGPGDPGGMMGGYGPRPGA